MGLNSVANFGDFRAPGWGPVCTTYKVAILRHYREGTRENKWDGVLQGNSLILITAALQRKPQQNGALSSLLLELHNFTQLRNCWLDLLWIWWVKPMNVKEITLQQYGILMFYDHYWENNPGTLGIFCFKDKQRLIWKLIPPASARMLSWNAPQKSMRQCLRNRFNNNQLLEEGKDAEKCVLCS